MLNEPIDDDALLSILPDNLHPNGQPNAAKLATAMGCSRAGVQRALARLARQGRLGTRAVLPGFAIRSISEAVDASGEVQKTYIKQAPAADGPFSIPAGHEIKGISALVDAHGQTVQQWIKTRAGAVDASAAIREAFEEYRGKSEWIAPPESADASLLTVYPIADFHLGMLAWSRETGANWDLRIAQRTIMGAIDHLIACAPASETAVILNLGDFTHADDQTNATPASGHQLDVDGRFPKIGKAALAIHVQLIEKALQKHSRVIVRCLPGNHDPHVSQMVSIALALFFESNPRVAVDDDPSDFWFHRHGHVMLAANHGHRVKPDDLPGVMASYRPDDWGKSKWRYAYSGHIHHKRGGEKHGAVWETFQTVAARDAYAHSRGYSAGRSLVSITHHRDRGELMRQTVSV